MAIWPKKNKTQQQQKQQKTDYRSGPLGLLFSIQCYSKVVLCHHAFFFLSNISSKEFHKKFRITDGLGVLQGGPD